MPGFFRKRPVIIEAVRWSPVRGNVAEVLNFTVSAEGVPQAFISKSKVVIDTAEGRMKASPGDWIIKGVHGEFYPCKPDIFKATYEPIDEQAGLAMEETE